MWHGNWECAVSQVHRAMPAQPESHPKSSPQSDAGWARLKALSEGNPHTDPLSRRLYASGMAELQRQWPLSSGRQQADLLERAEQMNRDARARASEASASKASPLKPTAIPTVSWDPVQWKGESDDSFYHRLHGWLDEKSGIRFECETVDADADSDADSD